MFKLRYSVPIEVGNFTKEQLGNAGGADALLVTSLLFPPDGSFSAQSWSWDGRNDGNPLEGADMFRVWTVLTAQLAADEELSYWQRGLAQDALTSVRAAMGIKLPKG